MAAILLATTALVSPALAQDPAAEPGLWGPVIDLEAAIGTDRQRGEADLFWPVWQDDRSMLFADFRGKVFDESALEGNFGFGYRQMLEDGWNIGGHGFFDVRQSENENTFTQVTIGAEALSVDWDFRANGYIPLSDQKDVASLSGLELQGSSLVMTAGAEVPLWGVDAEIGWRVPLFEPEEDSQLRVFAGGFHFESDEISDRVSGPRLRLEYRVHDLEWLGQGSRLTVSASGQHDDVRDAQGTFGLRLRIPLQSFGEDEGGRRPLTPIERRMVDPVVRDVDIVTVAGVFGGPESVVDAVTGEAIGNVVVIESTGAAGELQTALNSAGAGGMVIAQSDGANDFNGALTLTTGQTLLGGGSSIQVAGATSGTTATFTAPGARPTVSQATGAVVSIGGDNVSIVGLNFTGGGAGVDSTNFGIIATGSGTTGITLADNEINNMGADGVSFADGATTVTMTNNIISNVGVRGVAFGANAVGITLDGNRISDTNPSGSLHQGVFIGGGADTVTLTGNSISNTGDGIIISAGAINSVTLSGNTIGEIDGVAGAIGRYALVVDTTAAGTAVTVDSNTIAGTVGADVFLLFGGSYSGSGNVDNTTSVVGVFCSENGAAVDFPGPGFSGTGGGFVSEPVCGDAP